MSAQELELRNVAHAVSRMEYEAFKRRQEILLMLTPIEFSRYKWALEQLAEYQKIVDEHIALMKKRYENPTKRQKILGAYGRLFKAMDSGEEDRKILDNVYDTILSEE
jgi:hypothetical protein